MVGLPIESLGMVSYATYGRVLYCFEDTARYWSKILIFFIPPAFVAPLRGSRQNIAKPFGTKKTRVVSLPDDKKTDDMFSRFDRIPACNRRTDRQAFRHLATA